MLSSPRCVCNKLSPAAGQCTAGLQHAGVAAERLQRLRAARCVPLPAGQPASSLPRASPSAKDMMLGCLERWMLRNEGGVMGSNTQLLGQAHQASCSLRCCSYSSWLPGLLSLGRDLQSAVPQQRCTINAPCGIRAAFSPCSGTLDNYCHCLVALSTDFCTSALPEAVGFLLQGLGAVALLFCLGDFSRRIRLAEGARWGKERTGAAVVVMSEQEMPRGPSLPVCWFLLKQIGKIKFIEDTNLKHRS